MREAEHGDGPQRVFATDSILEESIDSSPEVQRVLAFEEIYPSCNPVINGEEKALLADEVDEENQDGVRTVDDDNFIDDIGVDPAHRCGGDDEHSPRRAPQAEERAEEGGEDAEINDRNVASDDLAMVDYSATFLAGVSAILDHRTSTLVSTIDVGTALSCEALRVDVSPFNLMDSGDGLTAKDAVAVAAENFGFRAEMVAAKRLRPVREELYASSQIALLKEHLLLFAHKIYEVLDVVRNVVLWEATTAFISLGGNVFCQRIQGDNGSLSELIWEIIIKLIRRRRRRKLEWA